MWGRSETSGRFYWLADASADPATWPLVARPLRGEEWHRLDMSVPEFIYRSIADPRFEPFTIADPRNPPIFYPADDSTSNSRPK